MATYNRAFCQEYPINRQLNGQGVPGVLIGRYNFLVLQMYGAAKLYISLSGTRVTLTPEETPGNC